MNHRLRRMHILTIHILANTLKFLGQLLPSLPTSPLDIFQKKMEHGIFNRGTPRTSFQNKI